jgi:hypothetical protein
VWNCCCSGVKNHPAPNPRPAPFSSPSQTVPEWPLRLAFALSSLPKVPCVMLPVPHPVPHRPLQVANTGVGITGMPPPPRVASPAAAPPSSGPAPPPPRPGPAGCSRPPLVRAMSGAGAAPPPPSAPAASPATVAPSPSAGPVPSPAPAPVPPLAPVPVPAPPSAPSRVEEVVGGGRGRGNSDDAAAGLRALEHMQAVCGVLSVEPPPSPLVLLLPHTHTHLPCICSLTIFELDAHPRLTHTRTLALCASLLVFVGTFNLHSSVCCSCDRHEPTSCR